MSGSDASTESGGMNEADIAPTTFSLSDLDISGAPAVVTWCDQGLTSNTRALSHSAHDRLTLQIHRDTTSNSAFIQLKANVALKARRDRTNVFLAIHPERIQTVAIVDDAEDKELATNQLATTTYCLQFVLARPPTLVVPQGDLTPKHKTSRLVLDSLQALAKQTRCSVHLPSATVAKARLVSLCEALSAGTLRSTPKFTDVASLYGGKGGRIIEHGIQPAASGPGSAAPATTEAESPPSYDELSLSSPPRPYNAQKSGMKRRRIDTTSDDPSLPRLHQCVHGSIETMCLKMMERIESGFTELGSRLDRMDQRLTDLETCVGHRADSLGVSIERVHRRSSEQVEELRDELDRGLYDVRKETEDIISSRVEDEMYVARTDLEDYVKDEMASAEERLEDKLQDGLSNAQVSLDINWNR